MRQSSHSPCRHPTKGVMKKKLKIKITGTYFKWKWFLAARKEAVAVTTNLVNKVGTGTVYCIVYIAPEKNWADLSLGCEPLNWDCVEMARLRWSQLKIVKMLVTAPASVPAMYNCIRYILPFVQKIVFIKILSFFSNFTFTWKLNTQNYNCFPL